MLELDGVLVVASLLGKLCGVGRGICAVNGHYGGHERCTTREAGSMVGGRFGGWKGEIMAGRLSTDTYTQLQPGSVQGSLSGRVGGADGRPRKDRLSGTDENRDLRHIRSGRHCKSPQTRPGRVTPPQRDVTARVSNVTLY